jgi:hypothetical protein
LNLLALVAAAGLTAVPLGTDTIRIGLSETVRIERPGTTAAYAVDAEIVEATLGPTDIALLGRSPGTTRVTVVGAGGIETWNVIVEAPPSAFVPGQSNARRTATWSEYYDSESSRVTTTLNAEMLTGGGLPIRFQVINLTKARETGDGFGRSAFPLATLSLGTRQRGVILGDELVVRSPLTLDGTLLRGVHLRAGGLEVHTGFASALTYGSLFVPAQRENALGASYGFGSGSFRVSPSLYVFPDAAKARPGARSVLPGLLVVKEGKEGLYLLGEVGWSSSLAAAGEATYQTAAHRLHSRLRHQPFALPALSLGHPQGTFADLSWAWRVLPRLGLSLAGASARYDDPRAPQRTAGASADLSWSLARHWSARTGVSVGRYDAEGAPRVTTLSLPAGLVFDNGRFGLSALYRYQTNSATNRGGNGGRVTAHAGGRLRLSAYADYERDAPTLSLLLRDYPEVARALAEQGLVARTPEDIARLLDASALLLAGDGPGAVRITLDPSRAQAGFELTWTGARTQARLHGLIDRTETTTRRQDTRLASISLTQHIASTELIASYTRWQSDVAAFGESGGAFQVGFRQRLSGGEPGSSRWARIAGHVYREGPAADSTTAGVPGVTVRLADGRTTVTDAGGNFVFDRVGRRGRRVEALLPAPNAFYTTPSSVDVKDSAVVRFGLRFSDGRLAGRVLDDAGQPVAGVALRLTGAGGARTAVSGSTGGFLFDQAAGDYELRPDPASLPAGYELVGPESQGVRISLAAPARADVAVRVQRSISGRVAAARAGVEVRLRTAGRAVHTDEQGRFLFRYVAAGPDTVEARVDGRVVSRSVDVPQGPAMLRDVELAGGVPSPGTIVRSAPAAVAPAPPPVAAPAPAPRTVAGRREGVLGPRQWKGVAAYGVQVASYPDRVAAEAEASRLAAAGGPPLRVIRVDLGPRGVWYRVLVTGVGDADAAQAHRGRILAEGREAGPVFRLEGDREDAPRPRRQEGQ